MFVGCYLTAHVYDNIAPTLTDQFHVYAVTRRGIGASDHPATGYDPQRRAADIVDVIRSLGMPRPIVVGNSCGGGILHTLGAQQPDPPRTEQERAALKQAHAVGRAMLSKWQGDLLAGVPSARIIELPDANLFMFLSNEADIVREVRAFAATLQQ